MKKILLLIGICLFNLNTYSQNEKIEYGIIVGLQSSSFIDNDENLIIYEEKTGYHAGIYFSFVLNKKISIRPELLYFERAGSILKMKGGRSGFGFFNIGSGHIYGEIIESLVFLPIIAKYKLNHRFSLGIGPVFGYSINRKIEYDDNRFDEFINNNNNTSEKFDLNLGIDFSYSLNNIGLFIRYNYGIKERQNLKTSLFQFGMNYKL